MIIYKTMQCILQFTEVLEGWIESAASKWQAEQEKVKEELV